MARLLPFSAALILAVGSLGAQTAGGSPYEAPAWTVPANAVDRLVEADLTTRGTGLAAPASDAVFLRRVFLDVAGALPTPAEAEAFLADPAPDKRTKLIETLFLRDESVDYATLRWCDLLRVKAEYPVNLWPNAVQAYQRWVHEAVRTNLPWDRFATALLTSSGSNVRVPAVNFYRAVAPRTPASLASAAALTFLGTRMSRWPEARKTAFAALFTRVAYKKTGEWKEEIVYLQPDALGPLVASFPDGTTVTVPEGADPRQAFAQWLVGPGRTWFARAAVNRIWAWTLGRGLVDPVDDLRDDHPAANPALFDYLARELVTSGYDLRHVWRLVLESRTYQQSPLPPAGDSPGVAYARYQVKRLDAEVIADALGAIAGKGDAYVSPIPEPFTFVPSTQRTTALADGSTGSPFLARFGRPTRDTGLADERDNRPSADQVLYLLNSTEVKRKLDNSPLLRDAYGLPAAKRQDQVRAVYLALLSRYPTDAEVQAAEAWFQSSEAKGRAAAADLAWALVNGREFLYRH